MRETNRGIDLVPLGMGQSPYLLNGAGLYIYNKIKLIQNIINFFLVYKI